MMVTLAIPDKIHRRLKIKAASEGTTMRALILHEIDIYLQSKRVKAPVKTTKDELRLLKKKKAER